MPSWAIRASVALTGALWLTACASPAPPRPPPEPAVALRSAPGPETAARPRLWFVGLAMESEKWSEQDVVETLGALRRAAPGFDVLPVVFSDRFPPGPEPLRPVAGEVAPAIAAAARQAGPGDVVLFYASTHGAPGLLGRELDGRAAAPVDVDELEGWLEPLRGHDTVLILSACFSGSFIPALAEPHRIIVTAARADRPSFGCQAGAEHTVFGQALIDSIAPNRTLHAIVDDTRRAVTAAERQLGVPAPSLPQVFVGDAVRPLYDAPVF